MLRVCSSVRVRMVKPTPGEDTIHIPEGIQLALVSGLDAVELPHGRAGNGSQIGSDTQRGAYPCV